MRLAFEEYETTPDGGADGGVADDTPSDEVSPEVETPEVAPEAVSPWAPSQEDWAGLTSTVQNLVQAVTPQPVAPTAPSYIQEDPVTGESLIDPAALQQYIDYQVNQRMGSYEPILNQTVSDRGEQLINQRLEQLQTEVGPFDPKVARQIAEGLAVLPGAEPNAVLKQAAESARSYEKTIGEKAVEAYKATLSNIGNAPREPGATGSAVDGFEPRKGLDGYKDVEESFLERHGISTR